MRLEGTRFGEIDVAEDRVMEFSQGLVGFPAARRFVLLERAPGYPVAWLQSLDVPALAFPVVAGEAVGPDYPSPSAADLARRVGLGDQDVSVLVVVIARPGASLVANLLAPLVVDMQSRRGAQIVLDPRQYAANAPLVVRSEARAENTAP
jgi:flagellar assembly factor FliW